MKIAPFVRPLAVLTAAVLLSGSPMPASASAQRAAVAAAPSATATTYYVDCGSDLPGIGTFERPLTSLAEVSTLALGPGDAVLFQRGATCEGALTTSGSGGAGAPIVVDAYGDEALGAPVIAGNGVPAAVLLDNQEHWEIRGLEITNTDPVEADRYVSVRRGVVIKNTDQGQLSHFRLENLYIHDVTGQNRKDLGGSGGIQLEVHPGSVPSWFDDVTIADNRIEDVNRSGINMSSAWMCRQEMAWDAAFCSAAARAENQWVPSTGLVIRDNVVDGTGGDGIVVQMNRGALVEGNVVNDAANRANQGSNAGVWAWNADDTTFRHNTVSNTKRLAGNNDGTSFDIDYGTRNTVFEYNVSYGNEGGMVFYCGCSASWLPNAGFASEGVYRYNVSIGEQNRTGFLSGATDGAFVNNTVLITDESQNEFLSVNDSGSSVLFANNLVVSTVPGGITTAPQNAPNIMTWRNNAFYSVGGASGWPGDVSGGNAYRDIAELPASARAAIRRLAAVDYTTVSGELDLADIALAVDELAGAGIAVSEEGVRDLVGTPIPACGIDIGAIQFSGADACDRPTALAAGETATIAVPAAATVRVSSTLQGAAELAVRNEAGLAQSARSIDGGGRAMALVRTSAEESTVELSCAQGDCSEIVVSTVSDVVVDGSFESLPTGYRDARTSPWSSWNASRSSEDAASGSNSLRLTPGPSGAGSELVGMPVRSGETYEISGWVNAASAGPEGLALGVKWGPGTVESGTAVNAHASAAGALEHVSARVTIPAGVDAVTVYCYQPAAAGSSSCDDVILSPVQPAATSIAVEPVSKTVPAGSSAHLRIDVDGDRPHHLAWERSVDGGSWEAVRVQRSGTIVPETSPALSVGPDDVDGSAYRAVVTDAVTGERIISAAAAVGVRAPFSRDAGDLQSVGLVTGPAKDIYLVGEDLDPAGLVVDARFSSGTYRVSDPRSLAIDSDAFSPWRVGVVSVPVSLIVGDATFATAFDVEVRDRIATTLGCRDSGATVTTSFHQTQYGSFPGALACDGDAQTSWSTWPGAADRPVDELTAEFPELRRFAAVEIDWVEAVPNSATVQYRTAGGDWVDAAPAVSGIELSGQGATSSVAFESGIETDALRLRVNYGLTGGYTKVSELRFVIERVEAASDDASLRGLQVDGAALEAFDPETTQYAAEWAASASAPIVTAVVSHPGATIDVRQPSVEDTEAVVVVTAADRVATRTYTIAFERVDDAVVPGPETPGGAVPGEGSSAGTGGSSTAPSAGRALGLTGGEIGGALLPGLLFLGIGTALSIAVWARRRSRLADVVD